jgi:hypothetical protein
MAAIYRNAFVTIAAVDTEDDNSGLFSARNGLQNRPCKFELDPSPATFLRRDIVHIVIPEMNMTTSFVLEDHWTHADGCYKSSCVLFASSISKGKECIGNV